MQTCCCFVVTSFRTAFHSTYPRKLEGGRVDNNQIRNTKRTILARLTLILLPEDLGEVDRSRHSLAPRLRFESERWTTAFVHWWKLEEISGDDDLEQGSFKSANYRLQRQSHRISHLNSTEWLTVLTQNRSNLCQLIK